jgi:hypothetical protein
MVVPAGPYQQPEIIPSQQRFSIQYGDRRAQAGRLNFGTVGETQQDANGLTPTKRHRDPLAGLQDGYIESGRWPIVENPIQGSRDGDVEHRTHSGWAAVCEWRVASSVGQLSTVLVDNSVESLGDTGGNTRHYGV